MSHLYGHNHHQLTIAGNTTPLDGLNFEGHETLSQLSEYIIRFTSPNKANPPQSMLMQQAGFRGNEPITREPLRGVISGLSRLSVRKMKRCMPSHFSPGWHSFHAANGGGSYIMIDANAIESGTLGDYRTRANHYSRQTRAKMPAPAPESPLREPGRHENTKKCQPLTDFFP